MGDNNNMLTSRKRSYNKSKVDIDFSYEDDSYNIFYERISVLFRILSFLMFAAFLFYIVMSAFFNVADFSYENFEYIIRNFALSLEEAKDDSSYAIRYNPDAGRSYSLFGQGLAVCGNSGITVYSSTGRLTCSESHSYKAPQMAVSDKFVLVYDQSGEQYSLYNSFSRVYSDKAGGSIRGAAVAENGYYALIVSSDRYNTAVELYDDTFSLVNRFNKVGYVTDVDISNSYLMIATAVVSGNNTFDTNIQVFDYSDKTELYSTTVNGNFPLSCDIGNGAFTLIGNKFTSFLSGEGETVSCYSYSEAPVDFSVNGDGVMLLFKKNGFEIEYKSVILNGSGSVVYENVIPSTVFDAEVYNGWSYYLTERRLIATDGENTFDILTEDINAASKLLSFGDGKVYVCTDTAAPLFFFP